MPTYKIDVLNETSGAQQIPIGGSCEVKYLVYTLDNSPPTLIDPPSKIVLFNVQDPTGTMQVTNVQMSRLSLGVYSGIYQSNSMSVTGHWITWCQATDSSSNTTLSAQLNTFDLLAAKDWLI